MKHTGTKTVEISRNLDEPECAALSNTCIGSADDMKTAFLIFRRNKNCKIKPALPKVRHKPDNTIRISTRSPNGCCLCSLHMCLCVQHLLDIKSLRYLSSVTLHDRITKSLLHLHKKKKPPSISAQFQVSGATAPCWNIRESQKHLWHRR